MKADASTGQRSGKHDGWRLSHKGHMSPCDRLCVKLSKVLSDCNAPMTIHSV
jgi:hypothetical protein